MVANAEASLIESTDVCSSDIPHGLEELHCDVIRPGGGVAGADGGGPGFLQRDCLSEGYRSLRD